MRVSICLWECNGKARPRLYRPSWEVLGSGPCFLYILLCLCLESCAQQQPSNDYFSEMDTTVLYNGSSLIALSTVALPHCPGSQSRL